MIKNKLDFKLINFAIITLIVYLMYQTGSLWLGVFHKFVSIFLPFFFAFVVAYAMHPGVKYLEKKQIPKGFAVLIMVCLVVAVFALLIGLVVPLLVSQMTSLLNNILVFVKEISTKYDLNLGSLQETLKAAFNDIIKNMGKYVSDGAINIIGTSLSLLAKVAISFSIAVYLLIDMDSIRKRAKKFFLNHSKKSYLYVKSLDKEMHSYLSGFFKIMAITLVEYSVVYTIIGHPNALLLGVLAAVMNLIPYFGGIISNCVAAITAFVISPALFFRTLITFAILSNVDGYVINPFVYGKTNKVHPVIAIMSVSAGGILMGVFGIVTSLPIAIILITTYNFYKEDIYDKLEDMKLKKD